MNAAFLRYEAEIWECLGHIVKIPDNINDEFGLELKGTASNAAPTGYTRNFILEFVWKPTSFERMSQAMKKFAYSEVKINVSNRKMSQGSMSLKTVFFDPKT